MKLILLGLALFIGCSKRGGTPNTYLSWLKPRALIMASAPQQVELEGVDEPKEIMKVDFGLELGKLGSGTDGK